MNNKSKMWFYSAVVALAFTFNANAGVSGFVDAQVATGDNVTGAGGVGGANSPTFRVGDGAVYFTEKAGSSSVMVDIPFMYTPSTTTTAGGVTTIASTNNTFTLATGKAQAYVSHGYDFGLTWSMGQWDSIYAHEDNDSTNNRFAQQGLLYAAAPVTHTGLLLDYASGAVDVKAFGANANGQGLRAGDNLDFGANVKYSHSAFYVSGGYMHHKLAASGESSMYTDFQLGTKQGAFTADAEVAMTKAAAAGAETGMGVGVWLAYMWNDTCDVAGRFEYTSKVGANYTNMQWTLGPSHKFNDKLTARLEYTGTSTTTLQGGTAVSNNGGILSTVFKF